MSKPTIPITVLLFGACREAVGAGELQLECAAGQATVAAAFAEVTRRFPQLENFERSILFAVNEDHVPRTHPLQKGDTLAIFPPVSGG